jgi:hypothetical protein
MFAFLEEEKTHRIWPEQQKSPTSTSSNFNLLNQTHHNATYHIIPNQPQEATTSSSTELGSGIAVLGTARYLLGHTRQ